MNPATVSRFAQFFRHPITRGVGNFVGGAIFTAYALPWLLEYLNDVIIPRFSNDPNVVNAAKESAKEIEAAQKEQTQNQTLTPETEQKIKKIFNDLSNTFNTITPPAQPVQK
jgi:predicted GTPase